MKPSARHIVPFAITCMMLVVFILLLGGVGRNDSHKLCEKLDVQLPGDLEFVTQEDVRGYLDRKYGVYIGVRLDSLDLGRIESLLHEKSVVMDGQAWTTRDGVLHVNVTQRAPAIRFQRGDEGFYMDKEGFVFPLHKNFTADVPVVEGAIPPIDKGEAQEWGMGMLKLMDYIASSPEWKDKIGKVSVNKSSEVELSPVEGKERIIIGAPEDIEDKFSRLKKYYTHIVPEKGEGYYKSVNLKFNKQIICRKDI